MKKDSGTKIFYDLKNETLKFAVKIPLDFSDNLININRSSLVYMKGGDVRKKNKEVGRQGERRWNID